MIPKLAAITVGYGSAGAMALLAQVPDASVFSGWLQYGALGILGGTTVGLFYVILRLIGGYKEMSDRQDGWEALRHADSRATNETLARLRENCAAIGKGQGK